MTSSSYLQVQLPSHALWVDKAEQQSLLTTSRHTGCADLPFPIQCEADAYITISRTKQRVETSLAATIEVRKTVGFQSICMPGPHPW